jgi:hypothetical protein
MTKLIVCCDNSATKQIFHKRNMRKPHSIKFISQAFKVSEKMNLKETLQYFDSLNIDYTKACKYFEVVKKLHADFSVDIEEPNV